MQARNYFMLFIFTTTFAAAYTFIVYCITSNPWTSTFITAAVALIFILENMDLNKQTIELENEILSLRTSANYTLVPKINELQAEIKQLKSYLTYHREHENSHACRTQRIRGGRSL